MSTFHLVDLISQRHAVREQLRGKARGEVLEWLAARGTVYYHPVQGMQMFRFESAAGRHAAFFFSGDELVFIGDHATLP